MMKKYTTPSLKVITAFAEDIIQTSGESAIPKTVVETAPAGIVTPAPATGYAATDFSAAYVTD